MQSLQEWLLLFLFILGSLQFRGENLNSGFESPLELIVLTLLHSLPPFHSSLVIVSCSTVAFSSCTVRSTGWNIFSKAEHLGGGSGNLLFLQAGGWEEIPACCLHMHHVLTWKRFKEVSSWCLFMAPLFKFTLLCLIPLFACVC